MEANKTNLNCFPSPSPLPSWGQDQALSGHLVGAVGASAWPQSGTEEEEKPFVIMEEENKPDTDDKWGDTGAREYRLWEGATGCELYQLVQVMAAKAASPHRAGSPQELHQWEGAVRAAWGDRAQQELYQLAQRESEDWTSAGDDEDWQYYPQTELSQEYQGEAEPELSQGEVSSSSEWEDCSEPELKALQDVSTEEDNSSGADLTQDSHESMSNFSFRPTPFLREDYKDDWDEVSVLELYEAEGSAQRLSASEADELPVPLPLEAWVESQAPESLCASLPSLYSEASEGQQGSEAGPQSPEPALLSPLEASAPQPGAQAPRQQPAALSKRPGRLRRALRALFRCRCLAPQPQE